MGRPSNFLTCPVSNGYDLDKIIQVQQYRRVAASELRPIVAIDTETYNGDILVLADSEGNYRDYPDITLENVVTFLFQHQYKWIFCWNLSFDGDIISKLLGEHLKNYLQTGRLVFTIRDSENKACQIRYIENKALTVKKGHHSVTIYDIAQFYDKAPLLKAYLENIKLALPEDYLAMKSRRAYFTPRYYRRNKRLVRHYCYLDCLYTKALAELWVKVFYDTYGFYLARWLSAGYAAEKVLIANSVDVPYFRDIPYQIQKLARASYYGGRIEMFYKGYVGRGYDYDINSAYPFALTTIPDLKAGKWIESNLIQNDAALGFFRIRARVHSSVRVSPFPFRQKNKGILYPFGQFETFVTLPELQAIEALQTNKIRYKILLGYQFIPSRGKDDCNYVFKDFIMEQFRRRQLLQQQQSPLQRTVKVILNSIYGKTAQKTRVSRYRTVMGNLFCPVIASHVTGFTRAQLFSVTHSHDLEQDIVCYATDSITTRRPLNDFASDTLGAMKLKVQANDIFMIQNGMMRANGSWKLRGVGVDRTMNIPIEHVKTSETKDGRVVITLKRLRPQRLKSAIIRNRIADIGKFQMYTKEINLNSNNNRYFFGKLTSVHTDRCFNSVPLDVNLDGLLYAKLPDLVFPSEFDYYDPYAVEP